MDKTKASGKERYNMITYTNLMRAAAVAVALSLACAAFALSRVGSDMSIEQLTRSADEIVQGNVVEAKTSVIGKRFETNYTIQVHDVLKTDSGMAAGREFTMTLPGGSLTTPPLTQYVSGVAYMVKGEEVVLFLKEPPANPSPTRAMDPKMMGNLRSSYKIVGWNQGRFSVLNDPKTGEKLVTRINLEDFGLMNTSSDTREILEAIQKRQLPLVRRQLLSQQGSAAAVRQKDPLEVTIDDKNKLTAEQRQQTAESLRRLRQRDGIPAQTLESFKQQVLQFANE